MAEAEVFSRPNDQARIHDLEKFMIWGQATQEGQKTPLLRFGERNGAPRMTFSTGLMQPKVLWVGFDPEIFEMFLEDLEEVSRGEPGTVRPIRNLMRDAAAEKGAKADLIERNVLTVEKADNGVVQIRILEGTIELTFKLLPNRFHHFLNSDGSRISPGEASTRYTRGLVRSLRQAMGRWASRIREPWGGKNASGSGSKPVTNTHTTGTGLGKTFSTDENADY